MKSLKHNADDFKLQTFFVYYFYHHKEAKTL